MMKRRRRKPKRTQIERRNETQAAILSASIDLLADSGYADFSASRVGPNAGVSRGAQEHYFPKKNDLIAAATRYAMREAVEHARSLARSGDQSSDPIEKFLTDSEHFFFQTGISGDGRDHDRRALGSSSSAYRHPDCSGCARGSQRHLDRHTRMRPDTRARMPNSSSSSRTTSCAASFFVATWLPYRIDRGGGH